MQGINILILLSATVLCHLPEGNGIENMDEERARS